MNELKKQRDGIIKFAFPAKLGTLNPHRYYSYVSTITAQMIRLCGIRLYANLPNDDFTSFELKPQLAEGIPKQMDEEGKVWHVKIKENMKWENGDIINAQDVLYSFKQMLDPVMLNSKAGNLIHGYISIKNADRYYKQNGEGGIKTKWEKVGIKAIDDLTIEITTEGTQCYADVMMHLGNTASTLVHKKTYEITKSEDGTETLYGTSPDKMMCGGSFIVDEWIPGKYIKFKKNPNYVYKELINIEGMEAILNIDETTQIELFEKGKVDYIQLSAEKYLNYIDDKRVLSEPYKVITSLNFNITNPEKPILNNLNFRNSIYYAINRKEMADITKEIPVNYYISTNRIINSIKGIKYRDTDIAKSNIVDNLGYDPVLAKKYFNRALMEEELDSVEVSILYGNSARLRIMAEYIKENVPKVLGKDKIKINLKSMPFKEAKKYLTKWKSNPTAYEIAFSGWAGSTVAPWNALKYHTSVYNNEPWKNEEFDRIWEEANYGDSKFEEGKRLEYTAKMEAIMIKDKPFIPISQEVIRYIKNDRIEQGFKEPVPILGFGWEYSTIVD